MPDPSPPKIEIFIPDGAEPKAALARTTHLGIGAHPDDLEIFAIHGIGTCYDAGDKWFAGVTVTHGGGAERDQQQMAVRNREQKEAARLGRYGAQFHLDYCGADIAGDAPPRYEDALADLMSILRATGPEIVYTHSIFDRHDTHGNVARLAIDALRRLPQARRPKELYGCEVWGGLDWVPGKMKVSFEVAPYLELQQRLIACHASQLAGNERYVEASAGRAAANATYGAGDIRDIENPQAVLFALDLMPLVKNPAMTLADFTEDYIDALKGRLRRTAQRCELPGAQPKG